MPKYSHRFHCYIFQDFRFKGSQKAKKFTIKKIFNEFRKIKTITFKGSRRLMMPLTKLQKGILEVMGISHEKLQEILE